VKEIFYNMEGKVCMVTGGNSGIGYETALSLAKMGADVKIVCRDRKRGEEAVKLLKEQSGFDKIELYLADLSDLQSIRSMTELFISENETLNVLINNAGIWPSSRTLSADGFEIAFATNHLGHFLLTTLLIEKIKSSAPSRIINVSALLYKFAKLDLLDVNLERKYSGFRAYCNSKLCNILFTYKLARDMKRKGVTVNTLHPGVIRTNLTQKNRDSSPHAGGRFSLMKSVQEGALTHLYLATSPEVEGITGQYFQKCKVRTTSKLTRDQSYQKSLWDLSEKMITTKKIEK